MTITEPKPSGHETNTEPIFWIDYDNGTHGGAGTIPNINEIGVDTALKHKDWPTEKGATRIGKEKGDVSPAISSYGYAVYREFLRPRWARSCRKTSTAGRNWTGLDTKIYARCRNRLATLII